MAWGKAGLVPGIMTGALATLIQLVAVRRLRRSYRASNAEFFGAVGAGMALRMVGVGVMLAAMVLDRGLFPPLPTALGFLGVLIPLLFLEVRQFQ